MVLTWTARAAGVLGLLCWALMDFAIEAAHGPGRSGLQTPLLWLGIAFLVLACALLGWRVTAGRPTGTRAVGAVVAVAVGAVLVLVCGLVAHAVLPHSWSWFRGRFGMLFGAGVIAVVALCVHDVLQRARRRRRRREELAVREASVAPTADDESGTDEPRGGA